MSAMPALHAASGMMSVNDFIDRHVGEVSLVTSQIFAAYSSQGPEGFVSPSADSADPFSVPVTSFFINLSQPAKAKTKIQTNARALAML
jgi:hypothetical protein